MLAHIAKWAEFSDYLAWLCMSYSLLKKTLNNYLEPNDNLSKGLAPSNSYSMPLSCILTHPRAKQIAPFTFYHPSL